MLQHVFSRPQWVRLFVVGCALGLALLGCTGRPQYSVYTPSPASNARVQFEYPSDWRLEELNDGEHTELTLCAPLLETPEFTGLVGQVECDQIIFVTTYLTYPEVPDVEADIARSLIYADTTPDYALVRYPVAVDGYEAERVEMCFNPGGTVSLDPLPVINHEVYFQIDQRIYWINAQSDPVERPCDPSEGKFPVFEHLLETLVILEP